MALAAHLGDFMPCVAIVAGQEGALAVKRETNLAIVALGYPAALGAEYEGRETPSSTGQRRT